MMRLVSVDIQKGGTYYHLEDREAKKKVMLYEKDILVRTTQCGSSIFTDNLTNAFMNAELGIPFESKKVVKG